MAENPPDTSVNREPDWNKKETPFKAFRDIAICAVILGGGLFFYHHRQQVKKQVHEDGMAAKELMLRDNPKDLAAAKAKFAEALALDPSDAYSTSSTALIETLLWSEDGVTQEKPVAGEWTEKAESHGGNIDERFSAHGLWLIANGKADEAEKYLQAVVERGAVGAGIANAMGRAKSAQGKLEEARGFLKKGHDLGWRAPRYADDLADSYFGEGDYINAQNFYAKGLEANSEHLRSMVGQARSRIARGQDLKKAADDLTAVLAHPDAELAPALKAMAFTGQAELKRFEQSFDEAAKLAGQAITADPSYPWAYVVQGAALASKGDVKASASFDKAIALNPRVAVFYFEAARSMAKLKDATRADAFMAAYGKSLKVDDRFHVVYGDLLRELGNSAKAEGEYNAAIKANGLNASAHYALGMVHMDKGDAAAAEKEFNAALGAQKTYPDAYTQLGNLKFAAKAYPDGCEQFAQALIQLKTSGAPREKIDGLLDEVNTRLVKAGKKDIAKLWMEQAKQLVR